MSAPEFGGGPYVGTPRLEAMSYSLPIPVVDTAICGRVFVAYQPERSTVARAERETRAFKHFIRQVPSASVFVWVGQPFPPPSEDTRAIYQQTFSAAKIDAAAYVVADLRGLSRSLVGSVATQMFAGSRSAVAVQVFTDPLEAAMWLVDKNNCGVTAMELLATLEELDRASPG